MSQIWSVNVRSGLHSTFEILACLYNGRCKLWVICFFLKIIRRLFIVVCQKEFDITTMLSMTVNITLESFSNDRSIIAPCIRT